MSSNGFSLSPQGQSSREFVRGRKARCKLDMATKHHIRERFCISITKSRQNAMIFQLFLATTSCRQEMGMSRGVCANMEPDFGQVFMPAQHSAYSLFISHNLEGGNARDFFPGTLHEHEESFRRQNCSAAAFNMHSA